DGDRRVLPAPGGRRVAHARRRGHDLRGAAAALRGVPGLDPRAAAPRPALPPEADVPALRVRPAAVDRRRDVQPRVPHPPERALARPASALQEARVAAEGVGEIAWATMNPAPETPLNVPIGPHRRFVGVRGELRDLKRIKDAFGGTVNDVVLTAVSGALREWLM